MQFHLGHSGRNAAIAELFADTFTASEGASEGTVLKNFVSDLMGTTPPQDMFVWSASEGEILVGCIFFSRLTYAQDPRTAFILSPVAVRPDRQSRGIGQQLINRGLDHLRQNGVDVVMTYGDPAYYAKTGFRQVSEQDVQAPLNLSFPEGWLAQSLSDASDVSVVGPCTCVPALNTQDLW